MTIRYLGPLGLGPETLAPHPTLDAEEGKLNPAFQHLSPKAQPAWRRYLEALLT